MAIKLEDRTRAVLNDLAILLRDELRRSLIRKKHKDTGKLLDSIEVKVKEFTNKVVLEGAFESYGVFQETGTRAGRLRNIGALEEWVKRRLNVPASKALGVAFAISKTHAKIGMHSKNGRKNNEAKGFMTEALNSTQAVVERRIEEAFDKEVTITIDNIINDFK